MNPNSNRYKLATGWRSGFKLTPQECLLLGAVVLILLLGLARRHQVNRQPPPVEPAPEGSDPSPVERN